MKLVREAKRRLRVRDAAISGRIHAQTHCFLESSRWKAGFLHDGQGRVRIRPRYPRASGVSNLVTESRYLYDGLLVVQERSSANTPRVTYTRGRDLSGSLAGAGGIGGLLACSHGYSGGNWSSHHFYHADGNGNITYLAGSTGSADAAYRYDPFGRWLAHTGAYAAANGMRFSSKLWLGHNGSNTDGLYYYGYRFYEPLTQRWVNRDPLGESGEVNLYTFGRNAPVLYTDPSGQSAIAIGGPIAGGCAVADGPLPIGDIIACGILIGCVIYDVCTPNNPVGRGGSQSKPRKCGDCTPAEHAALQAAVNAACKSGPRACKGNQDLATLEANLARNLACAAARDAINNKCFKGGDAGHRKAADEANKAAANCTRLIAQKKAAQTSNPQPPNPQPPPP